MISPGSGHGELSMRLRGTRSNAHGRGARATLQHAGGPSFEDRYPLYFIDNAMHTASGRQAQETVPGTDDSHR